MLGQHRLDGSGQLDAALEHDVAVSASFHRKLALLSRLSQGWREGGQPEGRPEEPVRTLLDEGSRVVEAEPHFEGAC